MVVRIDNGVVRINDLTFFQFCISLRGFVILKKGTDFVIPKFVLFWNGVFVEDVKKHYDVKRRKNDN